MEGSSETGAQARGQRRRWLVVGGIASLVLPLLGVAYIYWNEARPAPGPSGRSDMFEQREGGGPLQPSRAAAGVVETPRAPVSSGKSPAPVRSSLDFIKSDPDFQTKPAAPSVAPAPAKAPAPAPTPSAPTAAKKTPLASKKPFVMPKLQPTNGFLNFGSATRPAAGAAGSGASGGSAQDTQQLLQNLPPGAANNPEVQKYLQGQQNH